ncbi:NAD(P)-dependent oxidoreductase [Acidipropionibacterium jensenii]|uniref:NAD(P)-dependent oxidoreductase n=1 Tax=Acidipropionibacterium jensenii TaxID=1749 RepID=UPI00214CCB99|nr:NAD(P)-dependent oxidoreductase [Acidipropionibacterium jensenii]
MVQSVAVLGLGTMGAAMATRLADTDLKVTVWNRSPKRTEPFRNGPARVADSPAQAVEGADAVLTMVFDAVALDEVMATALPAMSKGAIWMQSSTIGPAAAGQQAEKAARAGVRYVDAPMLGTKGPAEQGTLKALVAGDPEAIQQLEPVLDAVASATLRAGEAAPAASALKVAMNTWIATITAGIGQAMTVAQRLGVDPALVLDALEGTGVDSPYAHIKGKAILADDFTPSFDVAGILKDLRLANSQTDGISPELLDALEALYARAAENDGGQDIAAVWKAFQS